MLLLLARNNKPDKIIEKKNSFETEENILSYVKKSVLVKLHLTLSRRSNSKLLKRN